MLFYVDSLQNFLILLTLFLDDFTLFHGFTIIYTMLTGRCLILSQIYIFYILLDTSIRVSYKHQYSYVKDEFVTFFIKYSWLSISGGLDPQIRRTAGLVLRLQVHGQLNLRIKNVWIQRTDYVSIVSPGTNFPWITCNDCILLFLQSQRNITFYLVVHIRDQISFSTLASLTH